MRKVLYLMGILSDTDVEWLHKNGEIRSFTSGETIIAEGAPVGYLFIVLSGELEVFSRNLHIARLQSGEVVGEISFVDSRPPLASVKAVVDARVLVVDGDLLKAKLAKDSGFASRFYRAVAVFLADRLRSTTSRFGYGNRDQFNPTDDPDELYPELLDSIDLAMTRFDKLLRRATPPGG